MSLTLRQSRIYNSLCEVYRASRTVDGTKLVSDDAWALVATGIPCHYEYTQNDSDPSGVGRIKRRTALTEDRLHCEVTADLKDGDLVRDISPGNPNQDTFHRVQGQPRLLPSQGRRRTNKRVLQLMQEEKPPSQVLVLAGLT